MEKIKINLLDILKSSLISLILSCVFTILFAAVLCFLELTQTWVSIINIVLKSLSICLGLFFGFKNCEMGLLKGLASGCIFVVVTYLISSIVNHNFSLSMMGIIDLSICIFISCCMGILVVNFKNS